MELFRERVSEKVYDDYEDAYSERGFAVGDYWNLASDDRPATPERFKVLTFRLLFLKKKIFVISVVFIT